MKKGFISQIESVLEFQTMLSVLEQRGVDANDIVINQDFDSFASTLSVGDTLFIASYCDIFFGLSDMFDRCIALATSGVEICSIKEPEIIFDSKNLRFLHKLHTLGRDMRSLRTQSGVNKAKANGKQLGRPSGTVKFNSKAIAVDKLHRESGITVIEACRIVGCSPQTYYRFLRAIR